MSKATYTFDYYRKAFEQAKKTTAELIEGFNDVTFKSRPAEDKWSAAEIISHLIQTGNEYLPQIKKPFKQPDEKLPKGSGPFTHNFLLQFFINQVSPANTRPLPTVSPFEPIDVSGLSKETLLSEFQQLQDEFLTILEEAESKGIDIGKLKTKNPVVKFAPMSVSSCFALADAHQRRHFGQIKDILAKQD